MALNRTKDHHSIAIELEAQNNSPHGNRNRARVNSPKVERNTSHPADDAETLLDPDISRGKPPVAKPEVDEEDDDGDVPFTPDAHPGVDDGFFPRQRPRVNTNGKPTEADHPYVPVNGIGPSNIPTRPSSPFPYAPGFQPGGFVDVNQDGIPDVNVYQHKKTLAQGMMDLALLSANANQLRYVLESYKRHPYYYPSLTLISISLIFQIAVGVGLIINSRYNVKDEKEICIANRINNFTVIGIFIVTIVNVFISAFGVADPAE